MLAHSEAHGRLWIQILERHAIPALGKMPLDRIEHSDVLRALTTI